MAGDWRDYLSLDDDALLAQCDVDHFRASGPGGQKRNKTDSAVRLRHRPTGLTGEAVEERSQHLNRARALRRLRLEIAYRLRASVALDAAPPTRPFALPGLRDARYPAGVAALFDALEAHRWRLAEAAPTLGLTTAALGRLLTGDDALFRAASERRQALGLPALRTGR
jgi:hypothetical protein